MLIPKAIRAYFNVQGTDVAGAGTDSWQINVFATTAQGAAAVDGPWGMAAPVAVWRLANGSRSALWWTSIRTSSRCGLMNRKWLPVPYNGNFSSMNFYALGDGETIGLYYIDSITLAESHVDLVLVEVAEQAVAFGFHAEPEQRPTAPVRCDPGAGHGRARPDGT